MKTTSVMINSLCVPCFNRCRYCLLSWDGKTVGAGWERSAELAERYLTELKSKMPDVSCSFSFGYSMEHPDLINAIRTLKKLGSPLSGFMQCDGMKMRDEEECRILAETLKAEGVKTLNFTLYGLEKYHDKFAGRKGDFALIMRMIDSANKAGLSVTAGIPLTSENAGQTEELVNLLKDNGAERISLFIPHEEGRGKSLSDIRLKLKDLDTLPPQIRGMLNEQVYKTEGEWLKKSQYKEENRAIIISLCEDNIEEYEKKSALSVVREIEKLDEAYYSSFPGFEELSALYGDKNGDKLYRIRDLYSVYRKKYAQEHGITVYDVTDERYSGSRRY